MLHPFSGLRSEIHLDGTRRNSILSADMANVIIIILAFACVWIEFIDKTVLKKAHKRLHRRKVRAWLKTVEQYDKLQLALACVAKVNAGLDRSFGHTLLSRKVVKRSCIISTCLLVITLAGIGLVSKQPFGITPWRYYKASATAALSTLDALFSKSTMDYLRQVDLTQPGPFYHNTNAVVVNIQSNYFLLEIRTNVVTSFVRMQPLGRGMVTMNYYRVGPVGEKPQASTNMFGNVTQLTTAVNDLQEHGMVWEARVRKYDTSGYAILYSIGYFIALFAVNDALFIFSLAFCRIVLREIALSGRLMSTALLVILDVIIVFGLSCVVLLLFLILAVPLLWPFIAFAFTASQESIKAIAVLFAMSSISLWFASGMSAKLVALIVLLPSAFAAVVGLFSLVAIRWKKQFHYLLKELLVRCVEAGPIPVVLSTITLVSAVLVFAAKYLHIFSIL